jgi:hypothetical protein
MRTRARIRRTSIRFWYGLAGVLCVAAYLMLIVLTLRWVLR